jgi:hypothetical protein
MLLTVLLFTLLLLLLSPCCQYLWLMLCNDFELLLKPSEHERGEVIHILLQGELLTTNPGCLPLGQTPVFPGISQLQIPGQESQRRQQNGTPEGHAALIPDPCGLKQHTATT